MNIMLIANRKDYQSLLDVAKQLEELGMHTYLPFGIYDNQTVKEKMVTVNAETMENNHYIFASDIIDALQQEKLDHTKLILSFEGKDQVDMALYYNPNGNLGSCELKEIKATMKQGIPVCTYQAEDYLSPEDYPLIHNLDQNLEQLPKMEKKKVR